LESGSRTDVHRSADSCILPSPYGYGSAGRKGAPPIASESVRRASAAFGIAAPYRNRLFRRSENALRLAV